MTHQELCDRLGIALSRSTAYKMLVALNSRPTNRAELAAIGEYWSDDRLLLNAVVDLGQAGLISFEGPPEQADTFHIAPMGSQLLALLDCEIGATAALQAQEEATS